MKKNYRFHVRVVGNMSKEQAVEIAARDEEEYVAEGIVAVKMDDEGDSHLFYNPIDHQLLPDIMSSLCVLRIAGDHMKYFLSHFMKDKTFAKQVIDLADKDKVH
eukprot:gnl/Carplike_NY0171/6357_a8739_284.p5 GENE.gnl/Carplike_NY0171/6357_a8739_284~~gnl/Carplike_NY0171/6357_a8739_284.p5  ORF type:complete len:104 (+),score=16.49 gnl/Carplike_NY0171/6357_a8739_284:663-974(+)